MENPEFIMLCGLSGCGKSTYADTLRENGYFVYSSDDIREELWGDAADQQNPAKVFQILNKRIVATLENGKNVVYDATNLSSRRRRNFLDMLKSSKIKCEKICHVIICPVSECIERDAKRERSVGQGVIWKQVERFNLPNGFEGWDAVEFDYDVPEVFSLNALDAYIEFTHGTKNNDHNNSHHTLTISEHMQKAAEYVKDKREKDNILRAESTYKPIYLAAKYHDVGKYFTRTIGKDGEAHFYNHQNVSTYMFMVYSNGKEGYAYAAAFLIQHHMDHFMRSPASMREFYEEIGNVYEYRMRILEEADAEAR